MGNYSYIIDSNITEVSYAEPVTLAEAKLYIRVSHTSEDAQISEMIRSARMIIEKATGLSLITKQAEVWFCNKGAWFQFPHGPITSSITLYDVTTGTELTDKIIMGGKHPVITFPAIDKMRAVYNVGFTALPNPLKTAILDQVNHLYENRGAFDETMGVCQKAWRTCQTYTKTSPVL
jgi:Phage gp6-like head-tail connector protein